MNLFNWFRKWDSSEIELLKTQIAFYQESFSHLKETIDEYEKTIDKYSAIIDIENEISVLNDQESLSREQYMKISTDLEQKQTELDAIKTKLNIFIDEADSIYSGVYTPIYDFRHSDEYREKLKSVREDQKNCIRWNTAVIALAKINIWGDDMVGLRFMKHYRQLMLRAFNGETEALIDKVRWNNFEKIRSKIQSTFELINELWDTCHMQISYEFLELKIQELHLSFEYEQQRQKEKEEIRHAQELIREEEKARREFEQAQKQAEKEEAIYEKAIQSAKEQAAKETGEKHLKMLEKIQQLEEELRLAQEKKARALSMAQQTKQWHVYIISNIWSFWENVYKIGMTRRLDPVDRVRELSDASVPFWFDIHAIIFSEDAPKLENTLHRLLEKNRVNKVNFKKEFFFIDIDSIKSSIKEQWIHAEFTILPEAEEYRETKAIMERLAS